MKYKKAFYGGASCMLNAGLVQCTGNLLNIH